MRNRERSFVCLVHSIFLMLPIAAIQKYKIQKIEIIKENHKMDKLISLVPSKTEV